MKERPLLPSTRAPVPVDVQTMDGATAEPFFYKCGMMGCILEEHHSGLCVFPVPEARRRRISKSSEPVQASASPLGVRNGSERQDASPHPAANKLVEEQPDLPDAAAKLPPKKRKKANEDPDASPQRRTSRPSKAIERLGANDGWAAVPARTWTSSPGLPAPAPIKAVKLLLAGSNSSTSASAGATTTAQSPSRPASANSVTAAESDVSHGAVSAAKRQKRAPTPPSFEMTEQGAPLTTQELVIKLAARDRAARFRATTHDPAQAPEPSTPSAVANLLAVSTSRFPAEPDSTLAAKLAERIAAKRANQAIRKAEKQQRKLIKEAAKRQAQKRKNRAAQVAAVGPDGCAATTADAISHVTADAASLCESLDAASALLMVGGIGGGGRAAATDLGPRDHSHRTSAPHLTAPGPIAMSEALAKVSPPTPPLQRAARQGDVGMFRALLGHKSAQPVTSSPAPSTSTPRREAAIAAATQAALAATQTARSAIPASLLQGPEPQPLRMFPKSSQPPRMPVYVRWPRPLPMAGYQPGMQHQAQRHMNMFMPSLHPFTPQVQPPLAPAPAAAHLQNCVPAAQLRPVAMVPTARPAPWRLPPPPPPPPPPRLAVRAEPVPTTRPTVAAKPVSAAPVSKPPVAAAPVATSVVPSKPVPAVVAPVVSQPAATPPTTVVPVKAGVVGAIAATRAPEDQIDPERRRSNVDVE